MGLLILLLPQTPKKLTPHLHFDLLTMTHCNLDLKTTKKVKKKSSYILSQIWPLVWMEVLTCAHEPFILPKTPRLQSKS
jgi:hypothetical protein